MTKIAVLMTTFNRSKYTVSCIKSLIEGNPNLDMRFVITDDNSTDDTVARVRELPARVHFISGNGSLFWNGGMLRSLGFALKCVDSFDYALLVNDDVRFFPEAIENLVKRINDTGADVVVGATCDMDDKTSYGGVKKLSKIFAKFSVMDPSVEAMQCDTFNCNCVLIKSDVFAAVGNLDPKYIHSMSDYDYGMKIRRKGYIIVNSEDHVGMCTDNDITKTWRNTGLSRKERLRLKESPKGLPRKDWWHFLLKNYGLPAAIYHSITPYVRILVGK